MNWLTKSGMGVGGGGGGDGVFGGGVGSFGGGGGGGRDTNLTNGLRGFCSRCFLGGSG